MYTGEQLDPGTDLIMTISGRPGRSISQLVTGSHSNLVIGVVALGLAVAVAGVWFYRRNRAKGTMQVDKATGAGPTAAEEMDDAETLLDAILALDDQFQAGELSEEAYRRRRAELKARLKDKLGSQGAGVQ
jgi:LPXTG-motif cell wall-anchored protein